MKGMKIFFVELLIFFVFLSPFAFAGYEFNEFPWGSNINENINLCHGGECRAEGDSFAVVPAKPKDSLTIVSYNVLRPTSTRIKNQINWLKKKFGPNGPDIILLSETIRGTSCGAGRNTAREYAKAFNSYYINGNEDGINSDCQTGNAVISRYPLGNVELVRFKSQADGSTQDDGRSFLYADIKVGSDIVHVYSTHLHHRFGVEGDNIRKAQNKEIVQHAKSKPFTKIIGGDFNSIAHVFANPFNLNDITLNPFFDDDYIDSHDSLSTSERITSQAGIVENDWILILDFIFVKNGTTSNPGVCSSAECKNEKTMSDHVPIWVDVDFSKNGALEKGFRQFVDKRSGLCMDIWGGVLSDASKIKLYSCHGGDNQLWKYEEETYFIRSKLNHDYCLETKEELYNGGKLYISPCKNASDFKWKQSGTSFKSMGNENIVIDAFGEKSGSDIGLWSFHGGLNQQWTRAK